MFKNSETLSLLVCIGKKTLEYVLVDYLKARIKGFQWPEEETILTKVK